MAAVPEPEDRDLADSLREADEDLREGRTTSLADLRAGYLTNGHRLIVEDEETRDSGPSDEAANEAMAAAVDPDLTWEILNAAHDPALGPKRSVCLEAVTSAEMRDRLADRLHRGYYSEPLPEMYADETADDLRRTVAEVLEGIEREFGGGA